MELLRVRERGQITIAKALREQLGIGDNSVLLAYVERGRLILEPVPEPGATCRASSACSRAEVR